MCCESCPLHVDLSKYKTDISHHEEMVQSYYLDIYFEPMKFMFLRRFDDRKEVHCISQKRRDRFTSLMRVICFGSSHVRVYSKILLRDVICVLPRDSEITCIYTTAETHSL